ncbi:MAG: hypothetical protein IKP81_12615 [Paludibacteraceae bacterium]|nr:hypothetical protein [Paludibacteraceae bacterium]MBR6105884.1 hypothetical protein [Paludibacteraceae bacterium]MCR5568548.1 hypothetical protein [Paludibacteraceae bacterium]
MRFLLLCGILSFAASSLCSCSNDDDDVEVTPVQKVETPHIWCVVHEVPIPVTVNDSLQTPVDNSTSNSLDTNLE